MPISRRHFLKHATRWAVGGILVSRAPSVFAKTGLLCVRRRFYSMGTLVTVTAYGESAEHLHHAISKIQSEFMHLESLMSVYDSRSDITKINNAAGRRMVAVDPTVIEALRFAGDGHKKTGGAFNICVEPLMRIWGFRESVRRYAPPTDKEIYRAVESASFSNLMINEKDQTAGLWREGAAIDLGGIAVGYAVDSAARILQSEGIGQALINHSGDIRAIGAPPDSDGWLIEVPDPANTSRMIAGFTIRDQAVSTSGNYEKKVIYDKKEFGHIIDPAAGFPGNTLLSFTSLCRTSVEADVYSTGYFVKGLPENKNDMSYIAVTPDGQLASSGLI